MSELHHGERERALARSAYTALERIHHVAYFSPPVAKVAKEMGLEGRASYVGFRAAPLGACDPSVVSAVFYNWNPDVIEEGWTQALSQYKPKDLIKARERIAQEALTAAFGELAHDDSLPRIIDRFTEIFHGTEPAGRGLGAANLALPQSSNLLTALWQASATVREWRGDGHNAVLISHSLSPVEAIVFHSATNPDPSVEKGGLGREQTKRSRSWGDERWSQAAESLAGRGLLTVDGDSETLTEAGSALYQRIEDQTDDVAASMWVGVNDGAELIASLEPFVKAILDAGFSPAPARK